MTFKFCPVKPAPPSEHKNRTVSAISSVVSKRFKSDHNHIDFEHPSETYSAESESDRIHSHIHDEFHKHGIAHSHDDDGGRHHHG